MEKTGVLLVSYGAREVAMADALLRSKNHQVELFVADKQRNPSTPNMQLNTLLSQALVSTNMQVAEANKDSIDFVLVGSEKPIIEGIRDLIRKVGIPVICPKGVRDRRKQGCATPTLRGDCA